MSNAQFTVSKGAWTDLGPAPLTVFAKGGIAVLYSGTSAPANLTVPAIELSPQDADGFTNSTAGERVYARAKTLPVRVTTAPVTSGSGGGSSGTVGQKTMAQSQPVTMASDQPAIAVSGTAGVGTVPTLPPVSISGVDATGAKRHLRTDAAGVITLPATVMGPDGQQYAAISTVRQKWVDDFGSTALRADRWEVYQGGTMPGGQPQGSGVTGITYSVSASTLAVVMGTTLNAELWLVSKAMFTIPFDFQFSGKLSQRLAENGFWFEIVECDPVTGELIPHESVVGESRNRTAAYFGGTTTAAGLTVEGMADNSPAISTLVITNFSTMTSDADVSVEARAQDTWVNGVPTDSNSSRSGSAQRMSRQVPDPTKTYKLRLRFKNIGTPATSTTISLYRILVMDVQELTAEITAGRGDGTAGKGMSVLISGGIAATQGNAAHAATISGNPLQIGGRAINVQPTAVATGQNSYVQLDLAGRLVVKPGGIPQGHDFNRVAALTATTETTLVAAVASNRHELQEIAIANRDNIAHTFDLRDAAAGTIRKSFIIGAGLTQQFTFPAGLPAVAQNTAWTVQMREAATTGVDISTSSYRTTA